MTDNTAQPLCSYTYESTDMPGSKCRCVRAWHANENEEHLHDYVFDCTVCGKTHKYSPASCATRIVAAMIKDNPIGLLDNRVRKLESELEERVSLKARVSAIEEVYEDRVFKALAQAELRLKALEDNAHEPVDIPKTVAQMVHEGIQEKLAGERISLDVQRKAFESEKKRLIDDNSKWMNNALDRGYELDALKRQYRDLQQKHSACTTSANRIVELSKELDDVREQKHQGDLRILELERDQQRRVQVWRSHNVREATRLLKKHVLGERGERADQIHDIVALLHEAERGFTVGDYVPIDPREMPALLSDAQERGRTQGVLAALEYTLRNIDNHMKVPYEFDDAEFVRCARNKLLNESNERAVVIDATPAKSMVDRVREVVAPLFNAREDKVGVLHVEEVKHPKHQVVVVCTLLREPDPSNTFGSMLTEAARLHVPQDVDVQVTVQYKHGRYIE